MCALSCIYTHSLSFKDILSLVHMHDVYIYIIITSYNYLQYVHVLQIILEINRYS